MRRSLLGLVAIAAFGAVITPLVADDPKQPEKKTTSPVGKPAYEFVLDDLDGATIKLADLKGKVVMMDFFETYCPTCNVMMPGVVAINAKYKDKGLVTLAIDREKQAGDSPETIRKFMAKHKIDFPVIALKGDMKATIWEKFDVAKYIPHYVIVDRKGVVRYKKAGGNVIELENTVKKLLDEKG